MKRQKRRYTPINEQIRGDQFQVVNHDGENLGVLSRDEALQRAADADLDLVLIAQNTTPQVVRILDYGKFKYEQEKAASQSRKGRKAEVKELRFKPNIDDHDLETRIKRAKKFLGEGNKVKITIPFFRRMIVHQELGQEKVERIRESLVDIGEIESGPTMEGKFMITIFKPIK